jgi:hypothetical protein
MTQPLRPLLALDIGRDERALVPFQFRAAPDDAENAARQKSRAVAASMGAQKRP